MPILRLFRPQQTSLAAAFLALIFASAGTAVLTTAPNALAQRFTVEAATDWTNLFARRAGWTGADGIYSIPLDGNERYQPSPSRRTAFVFSDSLIGHVDANHQRYGHTYFVNNTMALLHGSDPDPDRIRFYWGHHPDGTPDSLFIPDTAQSQPGEWYWLGDGIALNGKFYDLASRMERTGSGAWDFAEVGRAMISMPLNVPDPLNNVTQEDTPFFLAQPSGGRGPIEFGVCFMPNTQAAGAPDPDGYIYIYGIQNDPFVKKLLVARVLPDDFEQYDQWAFWDGAQWQSEIDDSAVLTGRVSSECSVSPLPDGRYILVYQEDTLGPWVTVRIGDSPVGPFGPGMHVWYCDEVNTVPGGYVYNAKAHPHLSKPGELLISYNVNTSDAGTLWGTDAYRPRFIRLKYHAH